MAKLWLYKLGVISVTVIYVTFSSISNVIYMGKFKFDKQRAKHVYPVLEMLNNKIKGLILKKKNKFENLEKKSWKLDTYRRTTQPLYSNNLG